jgi:group I intron endonuclease
MVGIYKITSPTKKVYIGQSIDIEKRFKNYEGLNCKRQPAIYNSFLKYGVNKHKFEIICECDILELNDKERYYQDVFSATGKNGLNCSLTKTNDRNGSHSEETKLKIGLGNKGKFVSEETRQKMSNTRTGIKHNLGRKHSKETKIKISEANMNNGILTLNIETGIYYVTLKEAAESINIKQTKLRMHLKGYIKNTTSLIYV